MTISYRNNFFLKKQCYNTFIKTNISREKFLQHKDLMITKQTIIFLSISFLPTASFSAENKILSLNELAFNTLVQTSEITHPTYPINEVDNIVTALNPKTKLNYINLLKKNNHPNIIEHFQFYTDNPLAIFEKPDTELKDECKTIATQKIFHSYSTILPISQLADGHKIACTTFADDNIYAFTSKYVHGSSCMWGQERPSYSKVLTICNTNSNECKDLIARQYNLYKELYIDSTNLYLNEPVYSEEYKEGEWLKKPQINEAIDTFSDGSMIITHPWGGIELHNSTEHKNFIINNSISSVSCSPTNNNLIALGSYDGTITLIDINQEDNQIVPKRNFNKFYHDDNVLQKLPSIVNSYTNKINSPITSIHYYHDNMIVFSSENYVYSWNPTCENEPSIVYVANAELIHSTYKDDLCAYSTKQNDIILIDLKENKEISLKKHSSQINALCFYKRSNDYSLITGDENGDVILWEIAQNEITKSLSIQHDFPVYYVEVTNNREKIIIKTTHRDQQYKHIANETIISCPTPHMLGKAIQGRENLYDYLTNDLLKKNDNPHDLYKSLQNNKVVLYNKLDEKSTFIKDNIEKKLLISLEKYAIDSITSLSECIDNFITQGLSKDLFCGPWRAYLSGMRREKDDNPLSSIDFEIFKKLQSKAIAILIEEFSKNPNNMDIVKFMNKYNKTYQQNPAANAFVEDLKWHHTPAHRKVLQVLKSHQKPILISSAAAIGLGGYMLYQYYNKSK